MAAPLMDLIHQAGFTGSAAQTMYAIVMAESGGNSTAHNGNSGTGDDSYGLAQINMIGSMGPQRLKQYGLSSNSDLYDPLTNLKVAYALSNGGKDFSPWTTYTRGTYQQYMGQSGALVSESGGGSGASSSGNPAMTAADYQDALGSLSGLLTGVPELKNILKQAVSGGWAVSKFQQAVEATKWYRSHNEATRQLISLQYSDPAEYKARIGSASRSVQQMATQLGVALSPTQLASLASQSIMGSWDTATLTHAIGSQINWKTNALAGQFGSYYTQLQQLYAAYGVPVSDATLRSRARYIDENGGTPLDTYKTQAIQTAKSMYPSLAGQLDSGLTVKDIADPYIQTMSNTLELDPNTINITDPLIKKALQGSVVNSNGSATATSVPLYQFESTLRSDPRWSKTQNARDTVSSALVHIGQDFGFSV